MTTEANCKVDRVIEKYSLMTADPRYDSLDEGLLKRWQGTGEHDAVGYRTLTEWFNKRLLRQVYKQHGRSALDDRVEFDYRALTSDDDLVRQEAIEKLDASGIDGGTVHEDMVSWGTMRTHLQECLDGDKEQPTSSSDWERDTVSMAKSFAAEKVESALSALSSKEKIDGIEESSVSVQIQLDCDHCPTRVPFDVALDRGYVCEQHSVKAETHS